MRRCYVAYAYSPLGRLHPTLSALSSRTATVGNGWIHEIKHDGFRILARRDRAGVRLIRRAKMTFVMGITFPMADF
jgi:hypothetical protein